MSDTTECGFPRPLDLLAGQTSRLRLGSRILLIVMFAAQDRILSGLRLLIEAGVDRALIMPVTASKE